MLYDLQSIVSSIFSLSLTMTHEEGVAGFTIFRLEMGTLTHQEILT